MILNSHQCVAHHKKIHDLENRFFGEDFKCKYDDVKHWLTSDSFFCSTLTDNSIVLHCVQEVCTMLMTTEDSATKLINNEIKEYELSPFWTNSKSERCVLYYSSLISINPNHARSLLRSVAADIEMFKVKYNIIPCWSLSIPTGKEAFDHLKHGGFRTINQHRYLQKYQLMRLDKNEINGRFWTKLLN